MIWFPMHKLVRSQPLLVVLIILGLGSLGCSRLTLTPSVSVQANDWIAFSFDANDGDGSQIKMVTITNSEQLFPSQIKSSTANGEIYVSGFSPDRKRMAFSYGSNASAIEGIFLMGIDGTAVTQITKSGSDPQWSSDGNWILFVDQGVDQYGNPFETVKAVNTQTLETFVCPESLLPYGSGIQGEPEWMGNTQTVLYSIGDEYASQFYACDVSRRSETVVNTPGDVRLAGHYVSPDGRKILYSVWSDEQGVSRIFKVADLIAGGTANSRAFVAEASEADSELPTIGAVAWAPDSQEFAIVMCYPGQSNEVFIYRADGSLIRNLTKTPAWKEEDISWLASGRYIVLTRSPSEVGRVMNQVVAVRVDDGREMILASEPEVTFSLLK